jgi:hypothetical protein
MRFLLASMEAASWQVDRGIQLYIAKQDIGTWYRVKAWN